MYFDPSQWPWSAALAHKEPRPQLHGAVVMSSGVVSETELTIFTIAAC